VHERGVHSVRIRSLAAMAEAEGNYSHGLRPTLNLNIENAESSEDCEECDVAQEVVPTHERDGS
jgi:hypothetical protein